MPILYFVFLLVAIALVFDFFNGFHDAANSVATVVITRVLSPLQAVLWAAFFNFVAAFFFGTGVAQTISNKLIDPKAVDVYVICGGLIGAIAWDIITWLMALPTSSSHAIISAYAGAAIAKAGWSSILVKGWIPVMVFLVISPIIGMVLGWSIMTGVSWLTRHSNRYKAEKRFVTYSYFRQAFIRLVTGPMTLKRPWASLSPCSPLGVTSSGARRATAASKVWPGSMKLPGGSS
jgi:PiT family inorganic phosphate transporter